MKALIRLLNLMQGSFSVGNFDAGDDDSTDGFVRYRLFGW